jgi:hypothetical protein
MEIFTEKVASSWVERKQRGAEKKLLCEDNGTNISVRRL